MLSREQQKTLVALEMELAAARHEGFISKYSSETNGTHSRKRLLAVIGIFTDFGRKNNRDAIRKSWLPTGGMIHNFMKFFFFVFCLAITSSNMCS